jgi:periplasmic divalent cation tolerance protein
VEEYLQVVTTTDGREEAEKVATALVEARLVACVQILGPIASTYWWKGKIESAEEWLCIMKTSRPLFDEVKEAIKKIHSYETPEIIAIPIVRGSDDYLQWLREEIKAS